MKEDNKAFSISYSGANNDELQTIKAKYTKTESNQKLHEIRRLDKQVDFISTMISIAMGMIGTVLLAYGIICIVQNPEKLALGCVSALSGLAVVSTVPTLHFKIAERIKKLTAPKILALIKEIEQNQI